MQKSSPHSNLLSRKKMEEEQQLLSDEALEEDFELDEDLENLPL